MQLEQVSYTLLNSLSCSYRNFLQYEGKLRGPSTIYLVLGNAIHTALERLYKSPKGLLSLEECAQIFSTELQALIIKEDVFVSYKESKQVENKGYEILERFFDDLEKGKISKTPISVEREFSVTIAGVRVVGKIDREDRDDKGLIVTDYKTGTPIPNDWMLKHNYQFTTYGIAAFEKYGEYPYKYIYHHLKSGEQYETYRDDWDREELFKAVDMAKKMKENDIRYRIFNEYVCKYCDFRGAVCEDKELEQQILARRV